MRAFTSFVVSCWLVVLVAFALWGARWQLCAAVVVTLLSPKWLPKLVVAFRMRLLTSINSGPGSGEGLQVPNADINCAGFRALYRSKAAGGRSEGAGLSDLFWYFLSPGPEIHPEQIENGPFYDKVNAAMRQLLAIDSDRVNVLLAKYAERHVKNVSGVEVVRLRDWYMPLFAGFIHELIFGDEASDEVLTMLVRHASNVIETLKWCENRDMDARLAVTYYCLRRIREGALESILTDGTGLSEEELALLLSNGFFNTGIVQSSEAMMHATLALAQQHDVANALALENVSLDYCKGFVNECLRLWPLFSIAHRILTETSNCQQELERKQRRLCPVERWSVSTIQLTTPRVTTTLRS